MRFVLFLWLSFFSITAKTQTDSITVTGTRVERPSMEVPASIDRVEAEDIRWARPQINLSESLGRVPGIVVQNRQNYAQDLPITSRGFGGRSTFGIRSLRLITDGIPAGFTQLSGNWRFSEFFRVDNLTNRRYAGSVVVNDANLRFYEPAPGRTTVIGMQAKLGF